MRRATSRPVLLLFGAALPLAMPVSGQEVASRSVDWPARWRAQTEIRVWFHEVGDDFEAMVWDAFEAWNDESLPLRVAPAGQISDANLLVMEDAHPLDGSEKLGRTTIHGSGGTIESAVIRLSRIDDDGYPIPRSMRRKAALHEVGHALGLGHSPAGRIMFGVSGVPDVTPMDRADLRALYRGAPADRTSPDEFEFY